MTTTIEIVKGDLFKSNCEALVNTVNCMGTMGKGLAKVFKRKFPKYYEQYAAQCKSGVIKPGSVKAYVPHPDTFDPNSPCVIFSFPTKLHWKHDSKYEYVETGMKSLVEAVRTLKVESVAIPALGCGNGNLQWNIVLPIIIATIKAAKFTHNVTFKIYEPENC